jgi:hypothetical protein
MLQLQYTRIYSYVIRHTCYCIGVMHTFSTSPLPSWKASRRPRNNRFALEVDRLCNMQGHIVGNGQQRRHIRHKKFAFDTMLVITLVTLNNALWTHQCPKTMQEALLVTVAASNFTARHKHSRLGIGPPQTSLQHPSQFLIRGSYPSWTHFSHRAFEHSSQVLPHPSYRHALQKSLAQSLHE